MEKLELTIIRNLVHNNDYARKVIPHLEPEYFEDNVERTLYLECAEFIIKYDKTITIEALAIEVSNRTDLTGDQMKDAYNIIGKLNDDPVDLQWLLDSTEKWCIGSCHLPGTDGVHSYC